MGHFRTTPNYDQPLSIPGNDKIERISTSWWRWFQDIDTGVPPSSEMSVTAVASPFTYLAKARGNLIVNGGTVTSIQFNRSGTFYTIGLTAGMFNLCANDQLKITYSSPPTLTFVPT